MNGLFLRALVATTALTLPALASAQSSPSDFTSAVRYDDSNRVTGTIAPDPDGSGSIKYAATRTTYDVAGRATRVETGELSSWQSESVAPSAWSGFTVFSQVDTVYDGLDRKLTVTLSSGGTAYSVAQYSYDAVGRPDCSTERMNTATFGSLPSSACTLGTAGSDGPDRITKNVYDDAGQLLRVQKAYGTSLQQDYVTYTYSNNGKVLTVKDADGNKAGYTYDGLDRLVTWAFPDKVTTGTISSTDYEAYTYDANGSRLTLRKRDGSVIGYTYDNLNRVTVKDIPGGTSADVYYGYDARGLQTFARFVSTSGAGITNVYDGFSRLSSTSNDMSGTSRTLSFLYDADGNRWRITYPDSHWSDSAFDGLDRWYYANIDSTGFLTSTAIDAQGRPGVVYRGVGASGYGYDAVSRVTSISHQYNSGPIDTLATFAYNPAGQITSKTGSNNAYAFTGYATASTAYTANGLNQYSAVGAASHTYDANGNLTGDAASTYTYDVENRLTGKSGGLSLVYDPLGRLFQMSGGVSGTIQFLYDGDQLAMEYDGSGNILRRYVNGPGDDDPYVWFEGSSVATSAQRFLYPDSQGSIVGIGDLSGSGTRLAINSYDEYGNPSSGNTGRFQYTGQAWLPDLGMYYYKARIYNPALGRFMQTDPIGYADQNNLYAYVGNDPIDGRDPSGQDALCNQGPSPCSSIPGENSGANLTTPRKKRASVAAGSSTGSDQADDMAAAKAVYGETMGIYPRAVDPKKSPYDPSNWDPASREQLEAARRAIAAISERNKDVYRFDGSGDKNPRSAAQWERAIGAANSRNKSKIPDNAWFFYIRNRDREPTVPAARTQFGRGVYIGSFGVNAPFTTAGGGDVGRSTNVVVDIYADPSK